MRTSMQKEKIKINDSSGGVAIVVNARGNYLDCLESLRLHPWERGQNWRKSQAITLRNKKKRKSEKTV